MIRENTKGISVPVPGIWPRSGLFSLLLILIFVKISLAGEWHVDKKAANNVTFMSSTSLLDFEGKTRLVDGYLYWEGDSVLQGKHDIYFEVQLASFETGIGKRDQDMRQDVLHTDKYPKAIFRGQVQKAFRDDNLTIVDVAGELNLHGIKRRINLNAQIEKVEERISVISNFSILLKDYNIEAPSLMSFIKVAQEIKLKVHLNMLKVK